MILLVISELYQTAKNYTKQIRQEFPTIADDPEATLCVIVSGEDELFTGVTGLTFRDGKLERVHAEANAIIGMALVDKTEIKQLITVSVQTDSIQMPCKACLDLMFRASSANEKSRIAVSAAAAVPAKRLRVEPDPEPEDSGPPKPVIITASAPRFLPVDDEEPEPEYLSSAFVQESVPAVNSNFVRADFDDFGDESEEKVKPAESAAEPAPEMSAEQPAKPSIEKKTAALSELSEQLSALAAVAADFAGSVHVPKSEPAADIPSVRQEQEPTAVAEIPPVSQEPEPATVAEISPVSQEPELASVAEIPPVPQMPEPAPAAEVADDDWMGGDGEDLFGMFAEESDVGMERGEVVPAADSTAPGLSAVGAPAEFAHPVSVDESNPFFVPDNDAPAETVRTIENAKELDAAAAAAAGSPPPGNSMVDDWDDDEEEEQESAPKTMEEMLAEQKARKKAAKANFNFFRRK